MTTTTIGNGNTTAGEGVVTASPLTASDPPKLVPRSITFTIPAADPGAPSVTVHAAEDGNGNIDITETVNNVGNQHSDLGGLFFDITNAGPLTSSNLTISGADVIYSQVGNGNVVNLAPNAPGINMEGVASFDVGVAFGNVTSTTFVLSNAADNLTLNDLQFEEFGARPMDQSEKITGIAPAAPTASGPGDSTTILEDVPVTIPVSALATDANPGATLTITQVTQPAYGSVTITNNGEDLVYNPDPGGGVLPLDYEVDGKLTGDQVTFQYAVEDSLGGTDSNTVTITETPVADPPTVATNVTSNTAGVTALSVTATSDDYNHDNGEERGSDYINPVTFSVAGLLPGATLSGAGLVNNGNGTYTLNGTSANLGLLTDNISVSAPGGTSGNLVITATADETEGAGSPATASTTSTQVIDIPQANPYSTTVLEDGLVTIPISDFAKDFNTSPSAGLQITSVMLPENFDGNGVDGTVSIGGPGGQSVIYNPGAGSSPLDYETNNQLTGDGVTFGYTVTNALGGTNSNTITVTETPVADTPSVSDSVIIPASTATDPATLTRLEVTAQSGDYATVNQGSDYIQSLQFSGVPNGVTLSGPAGTFTNDGGGNWTLSGISNQGFLQTEVDVSAPSDQTTQFNLGITAVNEETENTGSPATASSPTTFQPISVTYDPVTKPVDFTAMNQSIWNTGSAVVKTFNNFLGFSFPKGYPTAPATQKSVSILGLAVGGSFGVKFGFDSDLRVNSGSFNGTLPFNITLGDTYNQDNNTLQVDPTDSQAGGGSFTTTGPGGSYTLSLILDAIASAFVAQKTVLGGNTKGAGFTLGPYNENVTLLNFNSSQLHYTHSLIPAAPGVGTVTLAWPQVNTTGSNSMAGAISSKGSHAFLTVNIDPIAAAIEAAEAALGEEKLTDPLKGSKILGIPNIFSAKLNYTLIAATLAPSMDLVQAFNLNAGSVTGTLTPTGESPQTLTFGKSLIIDNAPNSFTLANLTPNPTLENETSLGGKLEVGVRGLGGSISGTLFTIPLGSSSFGPLFHPTHTFNLGTSPPIYQKTFAVNFSKKTLAPVTVA